MHTFTYIFIEAAYVNEYCDGNRDYICDLALHTFYFDIDTNCVYPETVLNFYKINLSQVFMLYNSHIII